MTQIIYISIITVLILIIVFLMRKIQSIKIQHRQKLALLYKKLSELTEREKSYQGKLKLEHHLNDKISDAKKQLNTEIFDLQMNLFKKITET